MGADRSDQLAEPIGDVERDDQRPTTSVVVTPAGWRKTGLRGHRLRAARGGDPGFL